MKIKKYTVVIHVERLVPKKQLGGLDQNMAGRYVTEVEAPCKKQAREFAADWFHGNFPIACLDDFDFSVKVKRIKA